MHENKALLKVRLCRPIEKQQGTFKVGATDFNFSFTYYYYFMLLFTKEEKKILTFAYFKSFVVYGVKFWNNLMF